MRPQHFACHSSCWAGYESFQTQPPRIAIARAWPRYVSPVACGTFGLGHTQVTDTSIERQVASIGRGMSGASNRRNRCRRTSRACWSLAALSSWQLAQERSRKNSSWSIPRRSRPSRCTPANTSNTGSGPAAGLVPSNRARITRAAITASGGRVRPC